MRQTETIANLLTIDGGQNDFTVYVSYNGSDIAVLANADIRHYMWEYYYEWSIFTKGDTLASKYSWLTYIFNEYCKEMQTSFNRIYAALMQSYDPTGDYSRHETIGYKNTRDVEYGKTVTTSADDYTTEVAYDSNVKNQTTTFDSTSLRDATKAIKDGSDTTTVNGEISNTSSGTDTITDTRLPADNVRDVVGNNNSPQQSIIDEINLRLKNDFTDIVMQGFADKYLFLLA